MKITKEQQYLILGVVALLVVGGLYYQFMLKPVWANIDALRATLTQKEKDLQEAKTIVAKYAEFKKRSSSIQRELEWFQNRIPTSLDRVKMLDTLQVLQGRSGVKLTDFQANAQPVKKEKYTEFPVGVRFTGSFNQMLAFIQQMTFAETLLTVRDIRITRTTIGTDPKVSLTAEMTVKGAMANAQPGGTTK